MTITVELEAGVESWLRDEAARKGTDVGTLARNLLTDAARRNGEESANGAHRPARRRKKPPLTQEERRRLIESVKGAYAGLPFSVEEYIQEKRAEASRDFGQ